MTEENNKHNYFISTDEISAKRKLSERNMRSVALFTVSVVYGLLLYLIVSIGEYGYKSISILALYAYGVLGGIGLLFINRVYADVDKSRKVLTEVLEKSNEARIITDEKGKTIYTNERFINFIHKEAPPTFESFIKIFAKPDDISKILKDLSVKANNESSASTELQANIEGSDIWLQVTCQHIAGWKGYVHWRIDDITSRYKMEATIREEREKLRDFSDNAPVGFFSVSENGTFIFANSMFLDMLKVKASDFLGKSKLHDYIDTDTSDLQPYECFKIGDKQHNGEIMLKSSDGKTFKASITQSIAKIESGIISRSVVYDLTKEQDMRKALAVSQDRFQRLFEESPIGICMLDENDKIINSNQALVSILNATEDKIRSACIFEYINDDQHKEVKSWLNDVRASKCESNLEVSLKSDKETIVQLFANKFGEDSDCVIHFIDLTERKNLEKQFAQSQKMQAVGQLAGGIAHDFNNLLTAMIGFADLLLLRHKPGDPSFSDINQIKQNANRASNMVRQLLAFSRQQTLKARVLDLMDVLSELSHLLRRLIGVDIELNISHNTNEAIVKADQGQIEQVLINLVVNARDAMPQGGKVNISTEEFTNSEKIKLSGEDTLPAGDWVIISVADTGTGIPDHVLVHIFEPFFSTKPVGSGTGLGLATVHGIVHQTGGRISVDTTPGKGTTFKIYLPKYSKQDIAVDEEKKEEEKHNLTDLTGSASILLVEDEDAVRIFSARALGNKGYKVVDVPGGEAALKVLAEKEFKPDMLITDVMMPEMDGTTLAKIVAEKYPDIKIIFMSGYAEDRFKEHVGGNAYFLPKPFTLKQLAERVKEVIES